MSQTNWQYNASVGWKQTWNRYFDSYCEATEQMYIAIVEKQLTDTLSYPFLFLVRHTLELGFKANIYVLGKYSGKDYGLDQYSNVTIGHILPPLHKALIDHFDELSKDGDKNSATNIGFYKHSKKLASLVSYFDKIDNRSFTFRYPVDIEGKQNLSSQEMINLKELKDKYDEAIILLKHTQDILVGFLNFIDDYRAEMMCEYKVPF